MNVMERLFWKTLTVGAVAAAALAPGIFAPKAAYAQDRARRPYTATCIVDGRGGGSISLYSFELSQGPGVPLYAFLNGYHPEAMTYVPFTSTPTNPNTLLPAITTVWVAMSWPLHKWTPTERSYATPLNQTCTRMRS